MIKVGVLMYELCIKDWFTGTEPNKMMGGGQPKKKKGFFRMFLLKKYIFLLFFMN
jgi:hypothetical protein